MTVCVLLYLHIICFFPFDKNVRAQRVCGDHWSMWGLANFLRSRDLWLSFMNQIRAHHHRAPIQSQHTQCEKTRYPTSECNFGDPVTFPTQVIDPLQVNHERQH